MNEITLDVKTAKTTIDRNIYGHFAEHLGRCIYEGVWVGKIQPFPMSTGIRQDVVAALRQSRFRSCVGLVAVLPMNITGRTA